jgi:uncharacterized membrane protein
MATSPTAPATTARRRVKKRILIPVLLLVLVLIFFGWLYVRGTWADGILYYPDESKDGVVTQLYRLSDDRTQVRCAAVVDFPMQKVWQVVSDHSNHDKFMPYVSEVNVVPKPDGRLFVTGTACSSLWGDWPFQVHVTHHERPDARVAAWDEPSGDTTVNRGSWVVSRLGKDTTLLVYSLEIEIRPYPTFLIRNLLMDRMHKVVDGVREEVRRRNSNPFEHIID